jgi:hypothetical protein
VVRLGIKGFTEDLKLQKLSAKRFQILHAKGMPVNALVQKGK